MGAQSKLCLGGNRESTGNDVVIPTEGAKHCSGEPAPSEVEGDLQLKKDIVILSVATAGSEVEGPAVKTN